MSGLEALGAAASAASLVSYGISIVSSITQICERVRDAPRLYRDYSSQVTLLISTAERLQRSPLLQVAEVYYQLATTLAEARTLQSALNHATSRFAKSSVKQKYWRTGSEQRKIFSHLESLQQKKTALLLCISAVQATQISSTQGSVYLPGMNTKRVRDVSMQQILRLLYRLMRVGCKAKY